MAPPASSPTSTEKGPDPKVSVASTHPGPAGFRATLTSTCTSLESFEEGTWVGSHILSVPWSQQMIPVHVVLN